MKNKKKLLGLMVGVFIFTMMLGAVSVSAATKTVKLSAGKWYMDTTPDTSQTVYHKIRISRTGYITFSGYGFLSYSSGKYPLNLQMCNSRKKAMQTEKMNLNSSNDFRNYIAVKKGTYYVRVKDCYYKLKYSFKAAGDTSGTSRVKAKNVPRSKNVQGLALMGERGGRSDWYKFTLSKAQKITFTLGARANGVIEFKFVPANPGLTIIGDKTYRLNTTNAETTQAVFPKGTYYIQVTRYGNDKNTSGLYTLKWR